MAPSLCPSLRALWPLLWACLASASLGGAACDAVTTKRTTEQIIPVEAGTPIHVENRNGWIHVRPGPDGLVTLRIHRRITAVKGGENDMDLLEVNVTKEKGALWIRGTHPEDPKQRRYQMSLVLTVPRVSPLTLHTDRGHLDLADLTSDVKGRTGDGEVRIQDLIGALDLETGAGNIQATGLFRSLRLRTEVGRVAVTLVPGSRLVGESSITSRRGGVTVALPEDVSATVTAEAHGGAIRSNLADRSHGPSHGSGSPQRQMPSGTHLPSQPGQSQSFRTLVGGGGPGLSLVSHRGDVRLQVAKRASPRTPGGHGTAGGR